ncbi:MAG: cation diffusion facilitator family transporter [Thermoanaerobaculum sp.]|nr:cation diffusion facilitator family transporter [Thermoanaerobaculum sp.]MDW7967602.1 cation diffusion facilitator family transporter [Thermoanaerobaculum sp.]
MAGLKEEWRKVRAARVAAAVAGTLALAKAFVGWQTHSLAVLAAAVDSLMDLFCSGLNAFYLKLAAAPPDEKHAFGHGKAEALSAVIQATVVAMGGLWLIGKSVERLLAPEPLSKTGVAFGMMMVSLVVSLAITWFLRREAKHTRSVALHADAFHYATDLASNGVAALGLLAYEVLGWHFADPLATVVIAALILRGVWGIYRDAADELLDRGLPRQVEDEVKTMIANLAPEVRGYRAFRSRRAGRVPFFEFRLLVDRGITFERSHEIAEEAIRRIRDKHGPDTQVMVDTDPV